MTTIQVLDKHLADMIAAGEVVERPASIVKELFENARDANADRITIEIKAGGRRLVKITDNGCGMGKDDALLSVVRHATSKIKTKEDLFKIQTMGFRGEALASISAVSKTTITTRRECDLSGTEIEVSGGEVISVYDTGCPAGTIVQIEDLFFNTPARLKFMKKDTTESAYIEEIVGRLILSNPNIAIKLIKDGREVYNSKGDGNLKNAIYSVYGANITDNIIEICGEHKGIEIKGYIGNPNIVKPTRKFENFSVNGRICKNRVFITGLENAYFQKIAQGKYPFCSLDIKIDYSLCDVNVHPQKSEIKFSNETEIYDAIYVLTKNALEEKLFVKAVEPVNEGYEYKTEIPVFSQTSYINEKEEKPLFHSISELKFDNVHHALKEDRPIIFEFPQEPEQKQIIEEAVINGTEKTEEEINFRIIGQVFLSYIILEKDEDLLMLDQHAAHERLNYEEIYNSYQKREISSQIMMSPKILELSSADYRLILDNIEIFRSLGIYLEDFNNNTIIVREIPTNIRERQIEALVYEILGEIKNSGRATDINLKLLFLVACKMSLKANTTLTEFEMEELSKKAFALNGKTTCPHGRPMFISFSKSYIENKFERT